MNWSESAREQWWRQLTAPQKEFVKHYVQDNYTVCPHCDRNHPGWERTKKNDWIKCKHCKGEHLIQRDVKV